MATLLLISDNRLYRETLAGALGTLGPFTITGTGRTGEDALRKAQELTPDAVLLDLPRPDGLLTLRALRTAHPDLAVVALGLPHDEREILAWAEAGASGFVLKDGSLEDLRASIEASLRGELHCTPALAAAFVRRLQALASQRASGPVSATLTNREREILTLVDQGSSNKDIARRLGIEIATVKNHVHNILEKLRVGRRAEAAAKVAGRLRRPSQPGGRTSRQN